MNALDFFPHPTLLADVPWALSYVLVALAIALGLAVVVRPSSRKAD